MSQTAAAKKNRGLSAKDKAKKDNKQNQKET